MILRDGTLVCALATAMLFASGAFAAPLEQTETAEIRPVAEVVWVDKEFINEHTRRACEAEFLLETLVPEPALATEPAKLYTERDVELLAKVIWAEARGIESDAEKAAVTTRSDLDLLQMCRKNNSLAKTHLYAIARLRIYSVTSTATSLTESSASFACSAS